MLAIHVPNLSTHRLWHPPSASLTPFASAQVKGKLLARACLCRSVKIELFETLGFAVRCAVASHFTLSPAGNREKSA